MLCAYIHLEQNCFGSQPVEVKKGSELTIVEQIADVIRQPAFIAGLGVAAWLVLMGFSAWLYCRHRRRKQLGHYTTSFAYTPAGGELIKIVNYPSQTEKRSTASNDSPIYSTINTAAEDDLLAYYDTYSSVSYNQGPDPYSSNPALSNAGIMGLDQDLDRWTIQSAQSGSEYAKLQYTKKSNVFPWKACPHPALTHHPTFSSEEEDDDWCPPLPARTYLMDASRDEVSSLPSKPEELMSSPQRDALKPSNSPRLQHFDLLVRHPENSQVSQSNPDLFTNTKALGAGDLYNSSQWVDNFRGESLSKGQFELI
ncbi:hypothetical protein GOODEAATRI_001677 [Goodea atripinnis]|uniref:Uncharacterized protein n=1 Tax=Goodea atripinnis TaxID=208336 RepID=A0ABV0ME83_9TELE